MGGSISDLVGGRVVDVPWEVLTATNYALTVLSWFENLPKDEQPPKHIWWSDRLLDEWFENVRKDRGGSRTRSKYDQADDAPMSDSSLADQFRPTVVKNNG